MRFFFALLAFLPAIAFADCSHYEGAGPYSPMSANFDGHACDQLLRMDDRACRPAMAILWQYFGGDPVCPARFTARYADRPHLVEFHFSDEACRKSHSCFWPRNYLPGFSESRVSKALEAMEPLTRQGIVDRLNEILAFIEQIRVPNTEIALSIGLEESYSTKARRNLVGVIRENWPFSIVAFGGGVGADFQEFHTRSSSTKSPCFASEDGQSDSYSQTASFFKHYAKCRAVFAFRDAWQGHVGNYKGKDPEARTFVISDEDVKKVGDVLAK
jgi:hypothetical protein